ncbi:MAG: N-acetylneuraminate synthase family protein, partial [Lachnospiraceae bacterium]|nr:N-acetylneuraminate synthase family protein [Lachnospiraceae bacterium]
KKEYPDITIGYSDHTKPDAGYDVLQTAYNLGAQVIEKHYTLDKTLSGNDHYHAMDEKDAKAILEKIDYIDMIRGSYELKCLDSETTARANARRSLVAACDIKAGETITKEMLTYKRPGTGISATDYDIIVGKTAACDITEDTILKWEMIK